MADDPDNDNAPSALGVAVLLRAARHHADLSQRELAAAAGVSRGLVGDLESGLRAAPRLSMVVRWLTAAGCRLVAVDSKGDPLSPRPYDNVLDGGGRHWPAHLDVTEVHSLTDWWYGPFLTDLRPLPTHTAQWRRLHGRPRVRYPKPRPPRRRR